MLLSKCHGASPTRNKDGFEIETQGVEVGNFFSGYEVHTFLWGRCSMCYRESEIIDSDKIGIENADK